MGTRAVIYINIDNQYTWSLYKHYDGAPKSLGNDIATLLKDLVIGNGMINPEPLIGEYANSAEDAVLQLILGLKNHVGDLYSRHCTAKTQAQMKSEERNCFFEYRYIVNLIDPNNYSETTRPTISCMGLTEYNANESILECEPREFLATLATRKAIHANT